jgi:hypothetical protein
MIWPADGGIKKPGKRQKKIPEGASFPPAPLAKMLMEQAAPKKRGDYNVFQLEEMRLRMRKQLGKIAPQSYDEQNDSSVRQWGAADEVVRDMAANMASRDTICARLMELFPEGQVYNSAVLDEFHSQALALGNKEIEAKANAAALHLLEEGDPTIVKEFLRALHPQFRMNGRTGSERPVPKDVTPPSDAACRPDPEMAVSTLALIERLRKENGGS